MPACSCFPLADSYPSLLLKTQYLELLFPTYSVELPSITSPHCLFWLLAHCHCLQHHLFLILGDFDTHLDNPMNTCLLSFPDLVQWHIARYYTVSVHSRQFPFALGRSQPTSPNKHCCPKSLSTLAHHHSFPFPLQDFITSCYYLLS